MKKLKCGFKTRQCGGRCVPVTMRCGRNHPAAEIKATVEAIEDEIKDKSVEHLCTIDSKTGEVLEKNIGDRTSVGIDRTDLIKGNIVTHNHPALTNNTRSEYYKGNSFSPQDVLIASAFEAKEMRAVTNTYRHSIKPGGKEWPSQETLTKSYNRHHHAVANEMRNDVFWGKRTLDHANGNFWHEVTKRVARDTGMRYSRATLKGDRADAYRRGFLYAVRNDRGQLKCKPGNKPCGGRCVPIKYKCKEEQELRQEEPQANPTPPQGLSTAAKVAAFAGGAIVTAGAAGAIAAQWAVGEVKKAKTDPDQFFFPKSEEDIAKVNEEYDKLEPGDLIHRAFKLNDDYFEHYAVYGGKDENGKHTVFQVGKPTPQGLDPAVQHEAIDEKDGLSAYKKVPDDRMYKKGTANFTREEIVGRAKTLVGKNIDYKVTSQNCENWARAIVEGTGYTTQGERSNGFVKAAGDIVTNVMASKVAKERESLGSMLDYLHQEAKQWRSPSFWEHKDLFTDTAKADADTPPSGSGVLVSPADFARRVDDLAKGSLADTIRTQLYSHYFQLVLALSQPKSMANSDSYDRAYRVSVRNDRTLAKKLKCGFKTRQCGGRCVPVTMRCGGNHSAAEIKATVEAIENEIKDKDTSQAYVIDSKTGEVKDLSHGNRFSRNTRHIPNKGNIVTRNSPRFGTGIGSEDIIMAIENEVKESRVVTKTHRHSLKPSNREWPSRDDLTRSFDRHWGRVQRERDSAVFWGKIPKEKAETFFWHELTKRVASDTGMIYSRTPINDDRADSYDRAYRISVRNDRGTVKCKPGNKPCGGRCVPIKYKCKDEKSSLAQTAPSEPMAPSPVTSGRTLKNPLIALAGVMQANGVATATATALGAATVGIVADVNRSMANPKDYHFTEDGKADQKALKTYDTFSKGDLIEKVFKLPTGYARHFAIYAGKDEKTGQHMVYEVGNPKQGWKINYAPIDGEFVTKDVSTYRRTPADQMYKAKDSKIRNPKDILRDAEAMVGKEFDYHLMTDNCETWARSIVEGTGYSLQGNATTKFTRAIVEMATYDKKTNKGRASLEYVVKNTLQHDKTGATEALFPAATKADSIDENLPEGLQDPESFAKGVEAIVKESGTMGSRVKSMLYAKYLEIIIMSQVLPQLKQDSIRYDRLMKCQPGNKRCGDRCVSVRFKCQGLGQESVPNTPPSSTPSSRIKNMGGIAVAVSLGVTGTAAVIAGTSISAAMADARKNVAISQPLARVAPYDRQTEAAYDQFEPGDLVTRSFKSPGIGHLQHFAIYAGKEGGEHYFYTQDKGGTFHKEKGSADAGKSSDYIKVTDNQGVGLDKQEVVKRAEMMLGTALDHKGIENTCENLARGVARDDWQTNQAASVNRLTRIVAPIVAKVLTIGRDIRLGAPEIRLNTREMQLWLAKRETGASFQDAKQYIFDFRKTGRTDSESDRFFDVANIQTPEEFVTQSVKDFGKIPGEIGRKVYEDRVKRYLMLILATCVASTTNDRTDAFASKDKATLSLAQKQLSTIVLRIVSRSYRNPIDRFLSLNIVSPTSIAGAILSKGSTIAFSLNLEKETLETRIIKEGRQDAVRRSSSNKCETGFSCGTTCITKKKVCKISLSKLASQPEIRQAKQLTAFLKEEEVPNNNAVRREVERAGAVPSDNIPIENLDIRELKKKAAAKGVFKYSRMNRAQLIDNIKAVDAPKPERQRMERTLSRKAEAERFTTNNALSDYAKDWDNTKKILKIAGTSGALTLAAAAMYFYGRAQTEIRKAEDNYREGFDEMAIQAEVRAPRLDKQFQKPTEKDGIIFAVGGYKEENSSGDDIAEQIRSWSDSEKDAEKWLAKENEIIAFNMEKRIPPFKGERTTSSGEYTAAYKGYLANSAIKDRLGIGDRGILNPIIGDLMGRQHTIPRNEDALELAAQIYAVARAKNDRPPVEEMDRTALTAEYKKYVKDAIPSSVTDPQLRGLLESIRVARGENSSLGNAGKPISILAHGAGGGTAREALEIIRRMKGGDLIARRVNLITLSSPRMGLTDVVSTTEKNLTNTNDPFHFLQTQRTRTVNGVKDREIGSYMKNSTVRDFITQSFEYSRSIDRKETVSELVKAELAKFERLNREKEKEKEQSKVSTVRTPANPAK